MSKLPSEHGGENYTDYGRGRGWTALFKEEGNTTQRNASVWISELDRTRTNELRSFIYSGVHSSGKREDGKEVRRRKSEKSEPKPFTYLRGAAAGYGLEKALT